MTSRWAFSAMTSMPNSNNVLVPSFRVPSPSGLGVDTPLSARGTGRGARGNRVADPVTRRDNTPVFVPQPFPLDTPRPQRVHPGALLSSIQLADFLAVLLAGAVALVLSPAYRWPLAALPSITSFLVLVLMMRAVEPGPRQPEALLRRTLSRQIADGA